MITIYFLSIFYAANYLLFCICYFVFVMPVPRSYLDDSRSFNGDPPHLIIHDLYLVKNMPLLGFDDHLDICYA